MEASIQARGALLVLAGFALAQYGVLAVDALLGRQWGFLLLEGVWAVVSVTCSRCSPRRPPMQRGDQPVRFRWGPLSTAAALTTAVALATAALAGCSTPRDVPAAAPAARVSNPRPAGIDAELIPAAFANRLGEARALVRAGADVHVKDSSEQSAYLIATSKVGDGPRLLELTLAAGADHTATAR